ncbi:hypothetical protein [Sedimenticola sp.]|uniref:hypothetical protein n=1 Tax=Sedimenticola sp. TaxID=1940285 RepID=UPI003D139409
MKKASLYSLLLMLLTLGASSAIIADESQESLEERCRTFAKEDNVPAAELAEYIKECVESLKEGDAEKKEKSD